MNKIVVFEKVFQMICYDILILLYVGTLYAYIHSSGLFFLQLNIIHDYYDSGKMKVSSKSSVIFT